MSVMGFFGFFKKESPRRIEARHRCLLAVRTPNRSRPHQCNNRNRGWVDALIELAGVGMGGKRLLIPGRVHIMGMKRL